MFIETFFNLALVDLHSDNLTRIITPKIKQITEGMAVGARLNFNA